MKRAVAASIVVLISCPLLAQKIDSVREQYVERFPDYFFLWPVIKQRSTYIEIQQNINTNNKITYKPNNSASMGFGIYIFEVGAEVTFALPSDDQKNFLYGKSGAFDLQANLLGKSWGGDIFYSRYNGFYLTDPAKPVAANSPYPQRPDIFTNNIGVNGIYVFNKSKFSLRSAYNFAERQRKSAGSVIMTGSINSYEMKNDSALYGKGYHATFGKDADVRNFESFAVSIAPGYTYTAVAGSLFLNLSFAVGPSIRQVTTTVADVERSSFGVSGFADYRVAIGYNSERFFTGVSFVGQSRSVKFEQARISAASTTFKILFGYRFREFGFLKKRATDAIHLIDHKR
ncbi:MAG: DUF4421 domain-containing protein [Cyclobacteriaceae bacterium]|nr:DUF4421 domain-containing protein [Cyclobacteriaceae bacterium]